MPEALDSLNKSVKTSKIYCRMLNFSVPVICNICVSSAVIIRNFKLRIRLIRNLFFQYLGDNHKVIMKDGLINVEIDYSAGRGNSGDRK